MTQHWRSMFGQLATTAMGTGVIGARIEAGVSDKCFVPSPGEAGQGLRQLRRHDGTDTHDRAQQSMQLSQFGVLCNRLQYQLIDALDERLEGVLGIAPDAVQ